MEIDELEKRVIWLDSERQKDKKTIAELQDQLSTFRESLSKEGGKVSLLESELKTIRKTASRVEKVDADFAEYKNEILKQIAGFDKKVVNSESRQAKQRKEDIAQLNNKVMEYQADVKAVAELKKMMQLRNEDALRLNQKVDAIGKSQSGLQSVDSGIQRQMQAMINDLSIENKRITDLQLETSTIRKRIEEDRNLTDLHKDLLRQIEQKLAEIQNGEVERRQDQTAFIERQNLLQIEKDTLWKKWQSSFSEIESMGKNFSAQVADISETHRSLQRAQQEFQEINERFNRRINEITEMNRLSEERFRQEWVAFKADDQKRWTNYTLTREEEKREEERLSTRVQDRLVALEDLTQDLHDTMNLVNEESQKQMRGLITLMQEMLDSYTQAIGKRSR